jgi:WhiB family transcriptional regulator, redox-sensing transcriptional regulator
MNWEARAACHGGVAALFFTPEGEHGHQRELRERAARAICAGCPVRRQCLESAMSADIRYGLWGGLSEDERRKERRNRARRHSAA